MSEITIDNHIIGPENPPFVIAELSANHNGSLSRALNTIEVVKEMGADAVKFQTYTADTMTLDCDKEDFQIRGGLWDGYNLYRLYQEAHTPYEWHQHLFDKAREVGITCFSTPFDETAVYLLEELNTPAYKIASFEIVDLPLIQRVAKTGKPMIMSTGMADLKEITEAVQTVRENGCDDIVLLHCISSYPAPVEQSDLYTIPDLAERYGVITGLSDHTMGTTVSVAGVALGACVIEKHVTLSRDERGPDSDFSLEPAELKRLCEDAKAAWHALGKAEYKRKSAEQANIRFRRSIYIVKNIRRGERLTSQNVRCIRPGFGLSPKYYDMVLGKEVKKDIERGTPLLWDLIE